MSRTRLLLGALVVLALLAPTRVVATPGAHPIEDYASYQPATRCSPHARPGTVELGRWLVKKYGGGFGPIARSCGGSTSEHTEGRAFDWRLDARKASGRRIAKAFLTRAFDADGAGNADALARRMGIMYVIWNDRIYSAWNAFEPEPYLSSSCTKRSTCSATLRHRDHVHVSLTRKAGRGETSWFVRRAG